MDSFTASTQYTDMRGTVAVDESDHQPLSSFLRKYNRISEEEYIAGISFFFHSPNVIYLRVYTTTLDDRKLLREASSTGKKVHPQSLRKLVVETNLEGFFKFFKRFSIKLGDEGLIRALDELDLDNLPES